MIARLTRSGNVAAAPARERIATFFSQKSGKLSKKVAAADEIDKLRQLSMNIGKGRGKKL
jgi:hypothetical protein